MAKLKVMFVVLSLEVGGTETFVRDMSTALPSYAIEPVVCCLDTPGEWGEELRRKGCKVFCLDRRPGVDPACIGRLRELIRREAPDIVNPRQYTPYFYAVMAAAPLPGRPRIIFAEHGRFYPDRVRWKRVLFNQIAALFTDEIVAVAEFCKKALVRYEGFPARRIRVIYNGIKTDAYSRSIDRAAVRRSLGICSDAFVAGTVGRLCAEKNQAMLLRAFADVRRAVPGAKLVIAGDGPLGGELRSLSGRIGVGQDVLFLGSRSDVPDLLHALDVFILSSDSEGASRVILEAMACGLPVVATAVGGNPELVINGETGILVPRGDHAACAAAILRVAGDACMRDAIGAAARMRFDSRFTFERMLKAYVDLFIETAVDRRRVRR